MRKILFTLLLALATTATASAQKFIEYGLKAGLTFPNFKTVTQDAAIDNRVGWQAGIVMRINTPIVAIQPELLYVRQSIDASFEGEGFRIKSNSINMPVLASFSFLKIVHLNVGPVFSLVNSNKYHFDGEKYDFGRLQPTMGYAVGLAVKLSHLIVDARFNGQFKSKDSINLHDIDMNIKSDSFTVSLAYLF